jgi:hypothetical protein
MSIDNPQLAGGLAAMMEEQLPRSRRCVPLPGRRWGARQGRIEPTGLTRGLPGVVDEGALQDGGHAGG